jgi:pimeloyl-ACP methyl ester carboxylesterase
VKKLTRTLLAGAGVTGALAAANRALQNAPLPTNALGGTRRPWTWRGHEMFATESGEGPLVILLHGIYAGASSYEYRKLFPLLARRHRVVAFDFLGCGLSAKPVMRYTAEPFVEQIVDALAEFGTGEPAALIGSSLGGAFTIRAATRAQDSIAWIGAVCPTGLAGVLDGPPKGPQGAITELVRTPIIGEAFFNALSAKPTIKYFLQHQAYGRPARATPEVIDHYYAVTHQPGARYVPAAFVGGALNCDVARDLPFLSMPLLVMWGERTPSISPLSAADEFVRLAKDARLVTFPDSGLLPHEEEPDAVDDAVEAFVAQQRAPA